MTREDIIWLKGDKALREHLRSKKNAKEPPKYKDEAPVKKPVSRKKKASAKSQPEEPPRYEGDDVK